MNVTKESGLRGMSWEDTPGSQTEGQPSGLHHRTLVAVLPSPVLLRFLFPSSLRLIICLILNFFPWSTFRCSVSSHLLKDLLVYFSWLWAPRLDRLSPPWAHPAIPFHLHNPLPITALTREKALLGLLTLSVWSIGMLVVYCFLG